MVSSGLDSKELKSYKFPFYILVDGRFGFFQQPYQHRGKVTIFQKGGGVGHIVSNKGYSLVFVIYCKYIVSISLKKGLQRRRIGVTGTPGPSPLATPLHHH